MALALGAELLGIRGHVIKCRRRWNVKTRPRHFSIDYRCDDIARRSVSMRAATNAIESNTDGRFAIFPPHDFKCAEAEIY